MKTLARPRGLQFEIVANLFVVMLAGLGMIALVMAGLAAGTVERAAVEQLRTDSRHLERMQMVGGLRLRDLAALAQTLPGRATGARWTVVDTNGRAIGSAPPLARPVLEPLVRDALARGQVVQSGGMFKSDLALVVPLSPLAGGGVLVGVVPQARLRRQLDPLLRSGAWVLATAATFFVAFGAYLLRLRIVLPVRVLQRAITRLGQGDLRARTQLSGSDELAELASGFNQMAESLVREREALVRAQESLSRSQRLASVGQLAAGVAHEVGNPVAAILNYGELVLRDPDASPRSREAAEQIRSEGLRVRSLVRELLDLARSQHADVVSERPARMLERVAERLRPQKLLDDIELVVRADPDLPLVESDPRRVEQIVINLVENAAHALAGRDDARIELRAEPTCERGHERQRRRDDLPGQDFRPARELNHVALRVIDNGSGIDAGDAAHVFDPFFTTKDPGEGTGLGLWNAHRLAELMGGRLELETSPGRTTFSLILPAADREGDPGESHASAAHSDH